MRTLQCDRPAAHGNMLLLFFPSGIENTRSRQCSAKVRTVVRQVAFSVTV